MTLPHRLFVASLFVAIVHATPSALGADYVEPEDLRIQREEEIAEIKDAVTNLKPTNVFVYLLDPNKQESEEPDPAKEDEHHVCGFVRVEAKREKDETKFEGIRKILLDYKNFRRLPPNTMINCYNPGVAIRFANGAKKVTFVICLECHRMKVTDGETTRSWILTDDGVQTLMRLCAEYYPREIRETQVWLISHELENLSAKQFDAFRISYDEKGGEFFDLDFKKEDATHLYGWKIDERKTIQDQPSVASAQKMLSDAKTYANEASKCFSPGFALRFAKGEERLTYIICLHCRYVLATDGKVRYMWPVSADGIKALTALYEGIFGKIPERATKD